MFLVDHVELAAIRKAYVLGGRSDALGQVRDLWPFITDRAAADILQRVLTLPVELPPADGPGLVAGRRQPDRRQRRALKSVCPSTPPACEVSRDWVADQVQQLVCDSCIGPSPSEGATAVRSVAAAA